LVGTRPPRAITSRDWNALNMEEDPDSLMKWPNEHRQSTASFRHQSTKGRAEFVANQIELEETVVGIPAAEHLTST